MGKDKQQVKSQISTVFFYYNNDPFNGTWADHSESVTSI